MFIILTFVNSTEKWHICIPLFGLERSWVFFFLLFSFREVEDGLHKCSRLHGMCGKNTLPPCHGCGSDGDIFWTEGREVKGEQWNGWRFTREENEKEKKSELLGDDGWAEQAVHGCFVLERLRESELGRTIELQKAGFRRKKNKEGRERTSSGKVALFFLSFRDYHCLIFYFYLFFLQLELFLLILLCLTILSFVNSDLITCLLLLIHFFFFFLHCWDSTDLYFVFIMWHM